ncbi:hypothetical protein Illi2_00045 [Pseudomonas phage vB_PpuM-Illi-2]
MNRPYYVTKFEDGEPKEVHVVPVPLAPGDLGFRKQIHFFDEFKLANAPGRRPGSTQWWRRQMEDDFLSSDRDRWRSQEISKQEVTDLPTITHAGLYEFFLHIQWDYGSREFKGDRPQSTVILSDSWGRNY